MSQDARGGRHWREQELIIRMIMDYGTTLLTPAPLTAPDD